MEVVIKEQPEGTTIPDVGKVSKQPSISPRTRKINLANLSDRDLLLLIVERLGVDIE